MDLDQFSQWWRLQLLIDYRALELHGRAKVKLTFLTKHVLCNRSLQGDITFQAVAGTVFLCVWVGEIAAQCSNQIHCDL